MYRDATLDDLFFIMSEIVEGARNGHFDNRIATELAATGGFIQEMRGVITERKRHNGDYAHATIYEVAGEPIGFVVMSVGEGYELWLAGIRSDMRGKGHGKRMIQGIVSKFHGRILFARVALASETMYHILLDSGFQHLMTEDDGFRALVYTR